MPSDPLQFMAKLRQSDGAKESLAATRSIPAVEASYLEPDEPLPPVLRELLKRRGLSKLYRHQALAINAIRARKHVTLVTPTASGKTLTCLLPILEKLLSKPDSKTLFLYPIKALAQDQLGVFNDYLTQIFPEKTGPRAAIYDGDSSSYQRGKMRQNPPAMILSNPDMLHLSFLPFHSAWGKFLSKLETVVIDEAHSYRGVFGAHVAFAIRRLRRLCHFYGSDPRFIFLSATIANPDEFSARLLGEATVVISENGAPSAERLLTLWNPQASAYREATDLFGRLVESGFKTIAFTKARKITELMSRWAMESWPQLKNRVAAYRAGYLPAERRELESRLFSGELDGIISTSALELGIDVGGLDACILVGFPGTMISTRQRMGRVGRDGQTSLVFMVGLQDALDQYFMKHPESFFERVTERALIPIDNPVIQAAHYAAAAAELPLTAADQRWFGTGFEAQARRYWLEGVLKAGADGSFHSALRQPHRAINIRSSGDSYMIEALGRGDAKPRLIGTLEVPRVYRDGHPGAIYLHQGGQYEVLELDQVFKRVRVREVEADYYTEPRGDDQIEILEVLKRLDLGHVEWCFGRVRASEQVTGYVTKHIASQKILSEYQVAMPLHTYETRAAWWVLPLEWRQEFAQLGYDFAGSIHALEHSQIAMLPVFAICDRWDLGGVSYWAQPQLDQSCIFIYDGHAGGAALAEQGFDVVKDWLDAVERLLKDCSCEEGCPACVQSPKCGNGNKPLDKAGALELTRRLQASLSSYPLAAAQAAKQPVPPTQVVGQPVPPPLELAGDVVVFDLETQFLAAEVGGWDNKAAMKISVAVTYSSKEGRYRQYTEGQIPELVKQLLAADLVVGFNVISFDYAVLQPYTKADLSKIKTLDMLVEITRSLGHRLKLDTLAQATLNQGKSAEGTQAVTWWREGNLVDLLAYCQKDVEITKDLWEFGRKHGYLLYEDKHAGLLKAPVAW